MGVPLIQLPDDVRIEVIARMCHAAVFASSKKGNDWEGMSKTYRSNMKSCVNSMIHLGEIATTPFDDVESDRNRFIAIVNEFVR